MCWSNLSTFAGSNDGKQGWPEGSRDIQSCSAEICRDGVFDLTAVDESGFASSLGVPRGAFVTVKPTRGAQNPSRIGVTAEIGQMVIPTEYQGLT